MSTRARSTWTVRQGDSQLSIVKKTDLRDGENARVVACHSLVDGLTRQRASTFTRTLLLRLYTAITGIHTDLLLFRPSMQDVSQRVAEAFRSGMLVALGPLPEVEIEVLPEGKKPASETEDVPKGQCVVPLKWALPEYRPLVLCRIRIRRPYEKTDDNKSRVESSQVVLKDPNGRLRFHRETESKDSTTSQQDSPPAEKITLDIHRKSWTYFRLSGELRSDEVGDASVEVHLASDEAEVLSFRNGTKLYKELKFTVFWFGDASITSEPNHSYHCMEFKSPTTGRTIEWRHTACISKKDDRGRPAITHYASVSVRPSGVPCETPQIKRLYVGFIQNRVSAFREVTYGNPEIVFWDENASSGIGSAVVAKQIVQTLRDNRQRNDTTSKDRSYDDAALQEEDIQVNSSGNEQIIGKLVKSETPPLYQRPPRALYDNVGGYNSISDDSLKPLKGCDGGDDARTEDAPSSYDRAIDKDYFHPSKPRVKVATIRYYPVRNRIQTSYLVWAVVIRLRQDHFRRLTAHAVKPAPDTEPEHFCVLRQREWALDYDSAFAETREQKVTVGKDAEPTMPVIEEPYAVELNEPEHNMWTEREVGGKVSLPKPTPKPRK